MRKKKERRVEPKHYQNVTLPAFGQELLRDVLIPEILGDQTEEILYWCGRRLARIYPQENVADLCSFFAAAGWGELRLVRESKYASRFACFSPLLIQRQKEGRVHFGLESGFLAEQMEQLQQKAAEARYELEKNGTVHFFVSWDRHGSEI